MRFSPPVVGVILAVLLALAFWFGLYRPASDQQALVEDEIATLEQQQSTLNNQIAQLRDIEARQVEIRAAMARLEDFIPTGPAQPSAIRQFQRAADQAGADITSVTFSEPTMPEAADGTAATDTGTPGTTLANIPVTMIVEGGYFQVVDFFRRLEVQTPRAVLVQSVEMTEATPAGFPTLSASWSGQLFAVVPLGDLADVDAGGGAPPAPEGGEPAPTETPAPEGGES